LDESTDKSANGQSVDQQAVDRTRPGAARRAGRKSGSAAQAGVGSALRSVYDEAVEEGVPQELLDLLGKLD
jgi:hypothetical protein